MDIPPSRIYVIDDDEGMRESLVSLLESHSLVVSAYGSAESFLAAARADAPACLVLDIRMPGVSGIDLQRELRRIGADHPVIFLTGHGTIPLTVEAMKEGALEFLTKPFTEAELLSAVHHALQTAVARWSEKSEASAWHARYACLTEREKEVFAFVASGRMNKVIASDLGIAEITVKVHRARVMEKLQTRTLADLVRIASRLRIALPG